MVFSFARIGAPLAMKVEDVFMRDRRPWVRSREKSGMPADPISRTLRIGLRAMIYGRLEPLTSQLRSKGTLSRTKMR